MTEVPREKVTGESDVEWLREQARILETRERKTYSPDEHAARLRAIAERLEKSVLLESLAKYIENSGKQGPGGIDITGGIPSEVYVGIGRDHFDDQYDVAKATAESVREGFAKFLRMPEAVALITNREEEDGK